jgi:spermidine synthase
VSALIYQVLWLRLLALVFGVTVHAATTVLASFMAGLALGSALAGRLADHTDRPLRWFGFVEIGIGVLAVGTYLVLPAIGPWFAALQSAFPDVLAAQTLIRFIGSFLVLLAPTTLMGMTLPLMLKAADPGGKDGGKDGRKDGGEDGGNDGGKAGRRIGVFYATNTVGAVLGALLTGYVLVGSFGISWSFRLAAAINILVGIAALTMVRGRTTVPVARTGPPSTTPTGPVPAAASTPLPATAIAVFALSGFAALALEVIWFRVLVYFVPATTYAFSTMLAAVLLGLALGSYAATPLLTRTSHLGTRLAWIQLATAFAVPAAAIAIATAYRAGWHTTADIHISLVLAFPPAFLMGMSYPLGLRLWAPDASSAGGVQATRIGNLNSANLLGGIAGAIAGGFLALPLLGTRAGLIALASPYLFTFVVLRRSTTSWGKAIASGAIASMLFGLVAARVPDMLTAAEGRRYSPTDRPFWRQEGAQTTVSIMSRPRGGLVLYLDGLHQASDEPGMVNLHRLIGHLPMAIHPNPKRALVVGLGGGVTPGAVSQHDTVVDIIELSSSVVEGARWFSHVNYAVTTRPNVRMRVDDGRNFLLSRAGQYDVITADLIQPDHAGAGNLYSREYFALMKKALAEGGVVLQWIGQRGDAEYKLILRTFLEVFPHTTLWSGGQFLVGTSGPLTLSRDAFDRKMGHESTRASLGSVGIRTFDDLLSLYVAGPDELRAFVGEGETLTDDRPIVEYFRSVARGDGRMVDLSGVSGSVSRHVVNGPDAARP